MEGAQLFLTEFLVDNINIPAIRAIHEGILPAKTCVSFQVDLSIESFINFPIFSNKYYNQ